MTQTSSAANRETNHADEKFKLGGIDAKVLKADDTPEGVLSVEALAVDASVSNATEQYEVTLTPPRQREANGGVRLVLAESADGPSQIYVPVIWQVRNSIEVSTERILVDANVVGPPVAGALLITSDKGTRLVVGDVLRTNLGR